MPKHALVFTLALLLASPLAFTMSKKQPQLDSKAVEKISPAHRGKPSQPLAVIIHEPPSIPESGNDEVILEATIQNRRNAQQLSYQWELPDGVSTSNPTSGVINTQGKGSATLQLTVRGFNKEEQKRVTLKVTLDNFTASSIVVSRPEDTLEYVAPVIRQEVEEFQERQRRSPRTEPTRGE